MKTTTLFITLLLGGGLVFSNPQPVFSGKPERGVKAPAKLLTADEILTSSVNSVHPSLDKNFMDWSVEPPEEFTVKKEIPALLANYKGTEDEKRRLLERYSFIWNYEAGTTYWVIENMRKVSQNSQGKIEHFGFKNYLEDNLKYMEDSLDYALMLFIKKKKIVRSEVFILALKSQRRLQKAGEEKVAPVIELNPLNYASKKCVKAKVRIILFKIKDNLKLFRSGSNSSTYSNLMRNTYSSAQYKKYISKFIEVNKAYFDALSDSQATLPLTKKWAYPFVSVSIWQETGNAQDFIVELYGLLYKNIYGKP